MGKRVSLDVDNLKIVGEICYPPRAQGPQPALCICHGIPAAPPDPADRGYHLLAEKFAQEGFISCIFNFRGAGESGGNLDLLGWTRDLDAVVAYLIGLQGVDSSRISLLGFSGGAAVSTYVAAHDKRISALAICACPAEFSIPVAEQSLKTFLSQCRKVGTIRDDDFPPSLNEWGEHFREVSPINWIEQISPRPLLIIHGDKDELIDPTHAQRLYDKAKEPKEHVLIPGGVHRLRTNDTAMSTALAWLKKASGLNTASREVRLKIKMLAASPDSGGGGESMAAQNKRQSIKGMGRDIFFSENEGQETRLADQLRIGEISKSQNAANEVIPNSERVASDARSAPAESSGENTGNDILAKLLGSSIRSRMLAWFITRPKEQFSAGQLQETFGANLAAIVREIGIFSEIGILKSEMAETESLYSLNPICPFLSELRGIILKTDGLIGKMREAISRRKGIEFAFIYGPFPNDVELGKNEIKLFIAGSAHLNLGALQSEMPSFGDPDRKSIKITYLPVKEFWKRKTSIEISLVEILEQPRIWLVGGEDALESSSSSSL